MTLLHVSCFPIDYRLCVCECVGGNILSQSHMMGSESVDVF